MRAHLEALLRARRLDATLTTFGPGEPAADPDRLAPTGLADVDRALGGGLRRGHVSEVVGAPSSGRTSVVLHAVAAATARGELVALVDACDTFDPASAAEAGVDLPQLLWVRDTGNLPRVLEAFSLILRAGGFGLVVLDLADVARPAVRGVPWTTWMRAARVCEGSETAVLLVGAERIARSPRGVTLTLDRAAAARWTGEAERARLFGGITPQSPTPEAQRPCGMPA